MSALAWLLIGASLLPAAYAYAGYPLLLALMARLRRLRVGTRTAAATPVRDWPTVSISLPAYNEERQIGGALDALLRLDYPADRLQIVVVSDASTDGTDAVVAGYAGRGVELVRLARRGGKGEAEAAAARCLRGDVVVSTDASIRILPGAVRALVAALLQPGVGVASGRDLSVGADGGVTGGERSYVGYEMRLRRLETAAGGIVGASGCLYATWRELHAWPLPPHADRDFAAPLLARERGLRSVSVDEAECLVPRAGSRRGEYRRKVRTMARGMETLWALRRLLNPFRYGVFAWMLFSHKVCRWLAPWGLPLLALGLLLAAPAHPLALGLLLALGLGLALGGAAWALDERVALPRMLRLAAFALAANVAAMEALVRAVRGRRDALWEPTRREALPGV